jgi:cell division septum initiation protein DivIVA
LIENKDLRERLRELTESLQEVSKVTSGVSQALEQAMEGLDNIKSRMEEELADINVWREDDPDCRSDEEISEEE